MSTPFARKSLAKTLMMLLFAAILAFAPAGVAFAEGEDVSKEEVEHNFVNERQLPDGSFLYDTSIEELAGADSYYDGQRVVISGEVVGDRVRASVGSGCSWLTVYSLRNSAQKDYIPSSIVIYVSDVLADSIDAYGRYGVRGSIIQVEGNFNLACVEHEGISDIHAQTLTVTQPGATVGEPFEISLFGAGAAALAAGVALMLLYRVLVERRR